ncbi:MAG: hypothetical protein KZQ81_07150 [Candidatus Thiodiazotropha sp. (ex Rostrolucina anterorostrata)]|nr:hypothetical protein [Candidatus Thiodiazotropha sp. (ex Rostrolucina anterorostrata)]
MKTINKKFFVTFVWLASLLHVPQAQCYGMYLHVSAVLPKTKLYGPQEMVLDAKGVLVKNTIPDAAFEYHRIDLPAMNGDPALKAQADGLLDTLDSWTAHGKSGSYFSDIRQSSDYAKTAADAIRRVKRIGVDDEGAFIDYVTYNGSVEAVSYSTDTGPIQKVHRLFSNPESMPVEGQPLTAQVGKIRGAGGDLMRFKIKQAPTSINIIELDSTSSKISFYENIGFQEKQLIDSSSEEEGGACGF